MSDAQQVSRKSFRTLRGFLTNQESLEESYFAYSATLRISGEQDVFLGYRSNVDTAGIEVPYTCLEMFIELQIPFGISIIIA